MTIVQVTRRIDRLEMAARDFAFARLVRQSDRLDPMNRVLEDKNLAQTQRHLVRQHRIRRRRADVEKERSVRPKQSPDLRRPFLAPVEIRCAIRGIGKFPVTNAEIVRRRSDHEVDRSRFEPRMPATQSPSRKSNSVTARTLYDCRTRRSRSAVYFAKPLLSQGLRYTVQDDIAGALVS